MTHPLHCPIALALALFAAPTLAADALVPGASLDGLLINPSSDHRYGVDGMPASARGVLPKAPNAAGKHWLLTYGPDHKVLTWTRFEVAGVVAGKAAVSRPIALQIDAEPPTATLQFAGATVTVDAAKGGASDAVSHILGPQASIAIEAADLSGGVSTELLVDGEPLPAGTRFQTDREDGRYRLALRTRDALGNEGERAATDVRLDSTPPTLSWQRLGGQDDVPADVFDGKSTRLSIRVSDAAAGVQSLQIGSQQLDRTDLAEGALELKLDADSLEYQLTDRVGNHAAGRIALRADSDSPQLVALLNGEPVDLQSTNIRSEDKLQLNAEDALAGVARACVKFSNGIHGCRSLPFELTGMTPGSYAIEFRAVDRLGNGIVQTLSMDVLP